MIANVATIGRLSSKRLSWFRPRIIITDEAHHAAADGYQNVLQRFGAFEHEGPYHLGVTATPHRLDNKPLHGDHVKAIFEEIVFQYGLVDAIKDGWLCDIRGYRVKTGVDLSTVKTTAGDYNQGQLAEKVNVHARNKLAFDKWYEIAKDRRTIVFCVDVEHSKAMRDWFTERGWACEHVDGTTKAEDRAAIMERFRSGATQILTNCNIATEGFDAPQIGCVLLMRPTKSWSLFVQMVGRGLRTAPGKEDCIIIDVVDTTNDHSLASIPGMFDLNPRQFSDGEPMVGGGGEEGLLFRKNLGYLEEGELVEVNLLEELQLPSPIRAASKLEWVRLTDQRYMLGLGSNANGDHLEAFLDCDALGRWRLKCPFGGFPYDPFEDEAEEHYEDAAKAIREAELIITRAVPNIYGLAGKNARWKQDAPTEKQIELLRRKGIPEADLAVLTKGQASGLITKLMKEKKRR